MISFRSLAISISWVALSAAPLIYAQGVKSSEEKMVLQTLPMNLEFQSQRFLAFMLLPPAQVSAPLIPARDLSKYREFQLGMNVLSVAKQADMKPAEARVTHQRPALIQELEWRPQDSLDSSSGTEPVKEALFSFYNGELFRIQVIYDQHKTQGLTSEDMVESISAQYGPATRPAAKIILFSSFYSYNDSEEVIARWEDSQYSFNLFRSSYRPTFGMLGYSKRLDPLAQAAIAKAIGLDEREAPQREIERQKKEGEETRAAAEEARPAEKASFRP
jgi:hypothetical protein